MKTQPMNLKSIRMGVLSDVHLGHDNTPTQSIANNIIRYFLSSPEVASSNIMFISGDLLDQLVDLSSSASLDIYSIMTTIIRYCSDRGIKLRILKGTPSHDYDQNQHFIGIAIANGIPVDIKYASTLSIEYIEEWDINILYVPDEWRREHSDTLLEVKALMIEKGIEHIDIAIMHGMFEQQVQKNWGIPTHDSKEYLALVKGLIFIGHDHRHQNYGRIVIPGSFDRLNHGEEYPKGFLTATLNNDYSYTVKFNENKGAKKYIALKMTKHDTESALSYIADKISLMDRPASIKLIVSDHIAYLPIVKHCRLTYPMHTWLLERDERKKGKGKSIKDIVSTISAPSTINITNIEAELSLRLSRLSDDSVKIHEAMNLFTTEILRDL